MHDELNQLFPKLFPVFPSLGIALELCLFLRCLSARLFAVIFFTHADAPRLFPVLVDLRWTTRLVLKAGTNILEDDSRVVLVVLLHQLTLDLRHAKAEILECILSSLT